VIGPITRGAASRSLSIRPAVRDVTQTPVAR
jgi:hypothetical protein